MKFFIVVAVALMCLAEAKKPSGKGGKGGKGSGSVTTGGKGGKGGKGDEGEMENMCGDIDPMKIGSFCVAGTAMGIKMEEAVAECYGADTMPVTGRAGKGKGKGKGGKGSAIAGAITPAVTGGSGKAGKGGKGKPSKPSKGKGGKGKGGKGKGGKGKGGKGGKGDSCPSFDDITSHLASEFADESCFMEKMGWTDNDMNFMEDVFAADMATLNSDLTDRIDEQEITDCAAKMVEKMGTEGEKCASSYTAEEIDNLTLIGQAIAHGTCGHKAFKNACMTYAKESFFTFITSANAGK